MRDDHPASTLPRSAQPGEIITFGTYPHMAGGTDRTPIRWRVLQNSGSELFVLSVSILDCKRYHGTYVDITWRDCDLRRWLNDEFYHAAFSPAEQELITPTLCTDNGEGSPDTEDRVFLLSVAEVEQITAVLGKDFRRATGTEYARTKKADGCRLYVMDKNVEADYIYEDGTKVGCSWWWLRNQGTLKDSGNAPSRAVFVGTRASIRHYARVNRTGYGVRPALKLRLR